jgi:hypothetical protein
MGFIKGFMHTCNIVCFELIAPKTRHRGPKKIPDYVITKKTVNRSSKTSSHKSRRASVSSTSSSESVDQRSHSSIASENSRYSDISMTVSLKSSTKSRPSKSKKERVTSNPSKSFPAFIPSDRSVDGLHTRSDRHINPRWMSKHEVVLLADEEGK